MSNDIGKISVKQLMILFILLYFAPAIRYIPIATAQQAKQAAWLSPIFAFVFGMIYTVIWWAFLKKYDKKSFLEIVEDIIGKTLSKIVCVVYFIWITFMLAYNLRLYAERLNSTVLTGVHMVLLLGIMMLVTGYIVKHGIVIIAKMGELLIIVLVVIFLALNFLIIPELDIKNLFPITYKDFFPALKGSIGILTIFSYNIVIMIFNDKIEHKGEFKKLSTITMGLLILMSILVIIIPLCVFGWSLLVKMPIPYLNAMTQISLFEVIERLEAGLILFWVFTDFILISVFLYSAIHIIKLFFKLPNEKPLVWMYVLFIFFLSQIIASSATELRALSEQVLTQANIAMGLVLPTLIFVVGRIRKKV